MEAKTKINNIIRKAEKYQEKEQYIPAYHEWDDVVTELNILLQDNYMSQRYHQVNKGYNYKLFLQNNPNQNMN